MDATAFTPVDKAISPAISAPPPSKSIILSIPLLPAISRAFDAFAKTISRTEGLQFICKATIGYAGLIGTVYSTLPSAISKLSEILSRTDSHIDRFHILQTFDYLTKCRFATELKEGNYWDFTANTLYTLADFCYIADGMEQFSWIAEGKILSRLSEFSVYGVNPLNCLGKTVLTTLAGNLITGFVVVKTIQLSIERFCYGDKSILNLYTLLSMGSELAFKGIHTYAKAWALTYIGAVTGAVLLTSVGVFGALSVYEGLTQQAKPPVRDTATTKFL
ncbi:MAG: hypothetical protein KDK40_05310 [Chlamydiia bacterium]|nr:hypothetical protein [Chlamydiia bacterium]